MAPQIITREVEGLKSRRPEEFGRVVPPVAADLPEGAVGFIARRPDRPERLAAYSREGALLCSFGRGQEAVEIATVLAADGFRIDDGGNLFRKEA